MWFASTRLAIALALTAGAALADPASPAPGPLVATLKLGVFCALQAMDQRPAPGTLSGWIHVPDGMIDFHWPDRQVVLLEPRRMRDRANDLLAEEDDLARTLASTWARDAERQFPRLHARAGPLRIALGRGPIR